MYVYVCVCEYIYIYNIHTRTHARTHPHCEETFSNVWKHPVYTKPITERERERKREREREREQWISDDLRFFHAIEWYGLIMATLVESARWRHFPLNGTPVGRGCWCGRKISRFLALFCLTCCTRKHFALHVIVIKCMHVFAIRFVRNYQFYSTAFSVKLRCALQ